MKVLSFPDMKKLRFKVPKYIQAKFFHIHRWIPVSTSRINHYDPKDPQFKDSSTRVLFRCECTSYYVEQFKGPWELEDFLNYYE